MRGVSVKISPAVTLLHSAAGHVIDQIALTLTSNRLDLVWE